VKSAIVVLTLASNSRSAVDRMSIGGTATRR